MRASEKKTSKFRRIYCKRPSCRREFAKWVNQKLNPPPKRSIMAKIMRRQKKKRQRRSNATARKCSRWSKWIHDVHSLFIVCSNVPYRHTISKKKIRALFMIGLQDNALSCRRKSSFSDLCRYSLKDRQWGIRFNYRHRALRRSSRSIWDQNASLKNMKCPWSGGMMNSPSAASAIHTSWSKRVSIEMGILRVASAMYRPMAGVVELSRLTIW